jgi:molybdopterin molybdotransferase
MLSNIDLLEAETVALENSLGRVLRENLFADRPFPPFDRVTMDGVAFRFSDLEGSLLTLQGIHAAGNLTPPPLKEKHCWQIMTGSVIPPGLRYCDSLRRSLTYLKLTLPSTVMRFREIYSPPRIRCFSW